MTRLSGKTVLLLFIAVFTVLLATVCGKIRQNPELAGIDTYYLIGSRENRGQLQDLFILLQDKNNSAEQTFAIVREISHNFVRAGEYTRLIHFLSERVINYPQDMYISYYLLMTAYAYMQQGSLQIAARYFDLIVKNYPDLITNGESIHFISLNQLIELTGNVGQRVWYYQELISRFPDMIDRGVTYFMLAQAYEHIGDWSSALRAYSYYLSYGGAIIPGFPNAQQYARQLLDLDNSTKDWTYESLPALLRAVQNALSTGNAYQLRRSQAKANFFTRTWGQWEDDNRSVDFNLANYMQGNRIYYANSLDPSSNSTEAFLRTWGWSQYVSTWYLYFRKINFPSDPEIHGRWEWVGIYYGEKF